MGFSGAGVSPVNYHVAVTRIYHLVYTLRDMFLQVYARFLNP